MTSEEEAIFRAIYDDRNLAHHLLFPHRHPNRTPEFHMEIIDDLHSRERFVCIIGFRESAKSTLAEEAVCIEGAFKEFRHCLVVGASWDLAKKRVHACRREFEQNDQMRQVFGDLVGKPWGDGFLELANGVRIQAMGRESAIRGMKEGDIRPDFILLDDIEDEYAVRTPEGREKAETWLFSELLPSGDTPNLRVRMLSNDRDPECIANKLAVKGSGWTVRRYPWIYKDPETGADVATWPDRFPLDICYQRRSQFYSLGRGADYEKEYMCSSTSPADKPFKPDMLRVEPMVRTWQPVMSIFDPARTIGAKSAHTGYVTGGWSGNRLIVWQSWGKLLLPDEIVSAVCQANEDFDPVLIGFEETGLNEWAKQPLRREQERRRVMLPLVPLKPPRGKLDFIRGMQPWFNAREVIFVGEHQELFAQLKGFPTGRIDVPNALAYLFLLRPGQLIYEDFRQEHIADDIEPIHGRAAYLALNADQRVVTAVLVQVVDGHVAILDDWIREGSPDAVLGDIVSEANLEMGHAVVTTAPQRHYERFGNVGLLAACRRVPTIPRRGAPEDRGASEIRQALKRTGRNGPVFTVSVRARRTLNAFTAGYAKAVDRRGMVQETAEESVYKVLMEGLEAMLGLLRLQPDAADDVGANFDYTSDGRRFISARARRS